VTRTLFLFGVLLILGAGWGLTNPLSKIAVSTGHGYFGLIVWQLVYGIAILGVLNLARGRGLPLGPPYLLRYVLIALTGTVIPNSVSYQTAVHLPAGVLAILISLVPMFALPIALVIGMERFSAARALGVACGAIAIVLIAGPDTSLPDPSLASWVLIGAIAPFMYAVEANWVARYGVLDLDPVQLLLGASIAGLIVVAPLALTSGQWIDITQPWGAPEWALFLSSAVHAVVYTSYVWLVGKAGSVFASQTAYLVTGTGVLWSMAILGETYSAWVWGALAVMLVGLFLVRPREAEGALVIPAAPGRDADPA
jgi:drug/metabolite transporter (DMT)-like permease